MAKATKKTTPQRQELSGTVLKINVDDIKASPLNPRKEFNEVDLQELANSIIKVGLIQPISVHKSKDEIVFEIICGERRWRAAQLAGLKEVQCVLYDKLSEDVILEMQVIENLQRKNINPMEESDAFQELIKRGISTAEIIADKIGSSTKYVYDRLILQKVIPEVQKAVRDNETTITHAKQFARLNTPDQEKLLSFIDDFNDWTVAEIRERIEELFNLKLENAPFDITDEKLVKKAGACTNCNKRSGCRLVLFEEAQQDDVCFDADCYNAKLEVHIEQLVKEYTKQGKTVKLISTFYKTEKENVLCSYDWDKLGEGEASSTVGILVERRSWDDQQIGDVIHIEDAEEDSVQNENKYTPSSSSNKTANQAPSFHWGEAITQKTTEVLCELYKTDPAQIPEFDIEAYLKKQIQFVFRNLDNDISSIICEKLNIPIILDEDEPVEDAVMDNDKTIEAFIENFSSVELSKFYQLLDMTRDAEDEFYYDSYPDEDLLKEYQETIEATGLSVDSIIKAIEVETGKEFKSSK